MEYMILDSAGNALASFEDEASARATLHAMAMVEPDAADEIALLAYDEEGMPVGEALFAWDLSPAVTVEPSHFVLLRGSRTFVRRAPRGETNRYVATITTHLVRQPRVLA